jgi:hypothetical protein
LIFFVADQVAGAEYVLPFLLRHRSAASSFRLFGSPVAAKSLARYGFDCEVLTGREETEIEAIFNRNKPAACFMSATGSSSIERSFLLACRSRRVFCVQCIDNWLGYRRRFTQGGVEFFPDQILTLDARAAADMITEGIPAELIAIVGQPYFEYRKSADAGGEGGDRLLLVTQPISRLYGRDLGYDEFDFVVGAVQAAARAGMKPERIDINIHPAEELSVYERHLRDTLGAFAESINLLQRPELPLGTYLAVVGMFSSVLVQAALKSVPVASFQPNAAGADRCFLSVLGFVPRFTSQSALGEFLINPQTGSGASELLNVIDGSCARFEQIVLAHESGEAVRSL